NQTPFYGESGGQAGDTGKIIVGPVVVTVGDTQKKLGDLIVHRGKVAGGTLKVGDAAVLEVDHDRRSQLRANHSVTHLLHKAL
ncbi:alanine--tRNA ligase-related protein, partial [Staphylococcus aureus]